MIAPIMQLKIGNKAKKLQKMNLVGALLSGEAEEFLDCSPSTFRKFLDSGSPENSPKYSGESNTQAKVRMFVLVVSESFSWSSVESKAKMKPLILNFVDLIYVSIRHF